MASMSQLTMAMVTLYSGDPKRIQHFMKVYAFAKMIAEEEQLGAKQREIVEAAALVHDIGIHAAEKKYRSAAGEYQEIEGPPIARAMLMALDFSPALINRVCDMVAHHHSYDKIDEVRGMDIIMVTTANTDEEARELLKLMGAPFAE